MSSMEIDDDDATSVAAAAAAASDADTNNSDDDENDEIIGPPWPQPQDARQRMLLEQETHDTDTDAAGNFYASTGLARTWDPSMLIPASSALSSRRGLRWGEYHVPDAVLDRWEEMEGEKKALLVDVKGEAEAEVDSPPQKQQRMAYEYEHPEEAEEEAVYSEVFESLGMELLWEEKEEEMLHVFGSSNNNNNNNNGEKKATVAVRYSDAKSPASAAPSLDGLPESVLHRIYAYSVRDGRPADVLPLERVCKYLHWCLRSDSKFWDRYDDSFKSRRGGLGRRDRRPYIVGIGGTTELGGRDRAFHVRGLLAVRTYQKSGRNVILSTLSSVDAFEDAIGIHGMPTVGPFMSTDDYGDAASNFRTLAERVVAKMAKSKSSADGFRLRGDTVGYLAELLQHWAVERLVAATLLAVHAQRIAVSKADIALLDRRRAGLSDSNNRRCSVALKEHHRPIDDDDIEDNHAGRTASSCLCSSSDCTEWCWPDDDCLTDDVLSAELRYKIARRLAYRAGVVGITADALELVAAELLHLLGVLVIDAFEMSRKVDYSRAFQGHTRVRYDTPGDGVDMFSVPPPPTPIVNDKGDVCGQKYTIVPGQIKSAAMQRLQGKGQEVNGSVYGSWWICTPDSDDSCREREKHQESLLYFPSTDQGSSDDEEDAELGDHGGYDTEFDDDNADIVPIDEEFKTFWGGSPKDCARAYLDEHGNLVRKLVTIECRSTDACNAEEAAQPAPKRRRH